MNKKIVKILTINVLMIFVLIFLLYLPHYSFINVEYEK